MWWLINNSHLISFSFSYDVTLSFLCTLIGVTFGKYSAKHTSALTRCWETSAKWLLLRTILMMNFTILSPEIRLLHQQWALWWVTHTSSKLKGRNSEQKHDVTCWRGGGEDHERRDYFWIRSIVWQTVGRQKVWWWSCKIKVTSEWKKKHSWYWTYSVSLNDYMGK